MLRKTKLLIIFVGLLFLVSSNSCKKEEKQEEKLPVIKNKKIVMIIASNKFRDEEYTRPREIFIKQGAKVTCASSTKNEVTGMLGMKVTPQILIDKIKVKDYDAIVFVGGIGAEEYFNNKVALNIAKEAVKQNKVLAAICIAPCILSNAGVLKDKKVTIWPGYKKCVEEGGAKYTGKDVEVDGLIITASGPEYAEEFGRQIVKKIYSQIKKEEK